VTAASHNKNKMDGNNNEDDNPQEQQQQQHHQLRRIRRKVVTNSGAFPQVQQYQQTTTTTTSAVTRVGQQVIMTDRDYELMIAIQRGITRSLKYTGSINTIDEDDYISDQTIHFRDTGVEFKSFCPIVFQKIRRNFNINDKHFGKQLGGNTGTFTRLGTPGKSGAFFYFCPSMQYLLKSVSEEEYVFLLELLPNYLRHVLDNPHTLLSNFFAFFEVTLPRDKTRNRFIVMNNVFYTHLTISKRYDLKGSTAGRAASEAEKKKQNPIWKDLDIQIGAIKLTHESKLELYRRVKSDCRFLQDNDIMDYSLLLGVHESSNTSSTSSGWYGEFHNIVSSRDGSQIYIFGIVDILQRFNSRKQLEKVVKSGMLKMRGRLVNTSIKNNKISVTQPKKYARRFEQFLHILCTQLTPNDFKVGSMKSFEKLDEAQEFYHLFLRQDSHEWKALLFRGILYHKKLNDTWNAMQDLNKSIKVNQTYSNVKAYLWRGMLHTELGDYDNALRDFTKLIEMNPYCADAFVMRGITHHHYLKNRDLAEKDYSKAIEINPNLMDPYKFHKLTVRMGVTSLIYNPYIQRGILYGDMGNYDKAIQEFKYAMELHPKVTAQVYYEMGKLHEKMKDDETALKHYTLSIQADPTFYESYVARGVIIRPNDPELAIEEFTKAIEQNPMHSMSYFHRGLLYMNHLSKPEQALEDLHQYLLLEPMDSTGYITRASIFQSVGKGREAESDYLKALEIEPEKKDVYSALITLYETSLRDLEESIDKIQFYTSRMKESPIVRISRRFEPLFTNLQ
jgi:tetratricopeptide (TPR) repeat protein